MTGKIAQQIRNFIVENFLFGEHENGLKDSDSLLENGIIDSTGVVELVSYLEETYEIEIEDDELIPDNLDSIYNVTQFIMRKQSFRIMNAGALKQQICSMLPRHGAKIETCSYHITDYANVVH